MTSSMVGVQGAVRQARIDRAKMAARLMATIHLREYLVVEINGMDGVFHVATFEALARKQERSEIGAYLTHFKAPPTDQAPPDVEKIEYRLGRKVFVFSSGALVYDDLEATGEYVVSEGVLTYLPAAEALAHLYGGVLRVKTFPEAVMTVALFAAGFVKPEHKVLIQNGILRVG